jgi:mRNA interferase HicA
MKRTALLRHLRQYGCELDREGGRHSIWRNLQSKAKSGVPRHSEIGEQLVRKICKDLGVPAPE